MRYAGCGYSPDRLDETWWEITTGSCSGCVCCQGYEVCLHRISQYSGGMSRTPTWPVLSLSTKDEALLWRKRLAALARTLDPEEQHFDPDVNGDLRIATWLGENGFRRHNHVCWWRMDDHDLERPREESPGTPSGTH
jgi:hypothetical protein